MSREPSKVEAFYFKNFSPFYPDGGLLPEDQVLAEMCSVSEFYDQRGYFPSPDEYRATYPNLVLYRKPKGCGVELPLRHNK